MAFAVMFVFFGLFECFYGLKALKPSVFIAAFGSMALIVMIFFLEFLIKP